MKLKVFVALLSRRQRIRFPGASNTSRCRARNQRNAAKFYTLGASASLAWHKIGTLLRVCRPCCWVAGLFVMSFMARRVLPSIMKFMCNHATCYQFSERFLLNTASKSRVCVCGENKDAKAKWKQESLFFWHPSTAFMSYDRNSINGHKFNLYI